MLRLGFNTQPPEGGWRQYSLILSASLCFNTQPPEGGWFRHRQFSEVLNVSTHSRPKAAGCSLSVLRLFHSGFNTQPPEGGWRRSGRVRIVHCPFQHTAARRRLAKPAKPFFINIVSTHSRPKAAGAHDADAGREYWFQHTAARRRLATLAAKTIRCCLFQHTAARRRLGRYKSTTFVIWRFNTQPPEGGWLHMTSTRRFFSCFNTQPPEGGWVGKKPTRPNLICFNTQPPEGGWSLSQKPCSIRFRSPDFAKLLRKARTRV